MWFRNRLKTVECDLVIDYIIQTVECDLKTDCKTVECDLQIDYKIIECDLMHFQLLSTFEHDDISDYIPFYFY